MSNAMVLEVCDEAGQVFLSLDNTGRITGFCGHVDLGTGIETALAQIVAEELNASLDTVIIILGDTLKTPDQGPTIASETIQVSAIPLRFAAASLKAELIARGVRRFNAPASSLSLDQGVIRHEAASIPIGILISESELSRIPIDKKAPLKNPRDYQIVGHQSGRRDLPDKVIGAHTYIHDVSVPGMLHGHVIRPPYSGRDTGDFVGSSLIGYEEQAIAGREGFVAIVREGDFLGVVATRSELARTLAEALPVRWRCPPPLPAMEDLAEMIRQQPSEPRVLDVTGDLSTAMQEADKQFKRSYLWPYHLHGSIGPSCAVADWAAGTPVVWCGSQNPHMLRDDLARLVNLQAKQIEVHRYQASGCYGRNCADDVAGDALLFSRAVDHPVRVQLTRAQETLWEPKGAAQVMDVEGALKNNRFHAYQLDTWYPSNRATHLSLLLTGRCSADPTPSQMGDRTIIPPYTIAHKKITVHDMAPVVRASWMRGVSALPNTFAHECFVDELAHAAEADPVQFRLDHIDDPRTADLIRRTAEQAGWHEGVGPQLRREGRMAYGRGFAFATYVHGNFPGTAAASAAWVCDVAVNTDTGEVTLSRVFIGQDQGLVINHEGVRQQIHGNVHQTAGRVLSESVNFGAIAPTQQSWADYPIMTFPETPEIETLLIERPGEPPLGVGESAAVPSASAIANAIFDATGVRLREVPFTPERVRAELKNAGYTPLQDPTPAKKRHKSRLRTATLAALGAVSGALSLGALGLPLYRSMAPSSPPPAGSYSEQLLEQGRQVFAAGNCSHCHTAEGGTPNIGGRAIKTPFGTIWTTNLTPDPETGLGKWSYSAFNRAMREGISRTGKNLYPAFPYTSFVGMSDDDMFALYAYLQTLAPIKSPTQTAKMIFPSNIRAVNIGWNMLFNNASMEYPEASRSDSWNRGRYLVETVGHCSACHSPRNLLGAEKKGEHHLSGAMVNGWYAPPLAGNAAAIRGWNEQSLTRYLQTGHTPDIAAAAGPMAEVVANLQTLPTSDIEAMASYLASLTTPTGVSSPVQQKSMLNTPTHRLFETACASCHEPAMPGMLNAAQVSLSQSMAVRAPSPTALATIVSEGLRAPDKLDLRDMPAFGSELSAEQIDDLSLYLRLRYAPELAPWAPSAR